MEGGDFLKLRLNPYNLNISGSAFLTIEKPSWPQPTIKILRDFISKAF
jgi:hypothetical protein